MQMIPGGTMLSESEVVGLAVGPVRGRYRKGALTLTVYSIPYSDDVLVAWPLDTKAARAVYRFCRCSGWTLAAYVIDHLFTLVPSIMEVGWEAIAEVKDTGGEALHVYVPHVPPGFLPVDKP